MSTRFEAITPAKLHWVNNTPYSCEFDDVYFSVENGLQESRHVFIDGNQLIERWQAMSTQKMTQFTIGETGFGTGLNFLLAWCLWNKFAPENAVLHFITCEKHPLSYYDLAQCMSLWPELKAQAQQLLQGYPTTTPGYHTLIFDKGRVNLHLMIGDGGGLFEQRLICADATFEGTLPRATVDAWFLDGFSPAKNPSLWGEQLFYVINCLSNVNTTIATYSSAGFVKRALQSAGFAVTKKTGFGKKRDMLVAKFEHYVVRKGIKRHTPWYMVTPPTLTHRKSALIVGSGLSGCYLAYALANRGFEVTILDKHSEVAQGASFNHQAVLYPKLSAYRSPFTEFMLTSYLFALNSYKMLLGRTLTGMLQLASNAKDADYQKNLQSWLMQFPKLGVLVDKVRASELSGVELEVGGIYFPEAGWIDMIALCQQLLMHSAIHWQGNQTIKELTFKEGRWYASGHRADVLIVAAGYESNQFTQTEYLPIKPIAGQMSIIPENDDSRWLAIPLCGAGHVLPSWQGNHYVGATYHLNQTAITNLAEDDRLNINRLNNLPVKLPWSEEVLNHWVGVRAATPDYLPLVGSVCDPQQFLKQFSGFSSDANRWIPCSYSNNLHGLYVCSGFGSRGLSSIPICAEWLAATINLEPSFLPRSIIQALSPSRFLRRKLMRKG